MIKRELYMSRIRPFIGTELVKVMAGIRRCGKSVMLELIQQELTESGVSPAQFISINFEDMGYSHLQTAAGAARRDHQTRRRRLAARSTSSSMRSRRSRTGRSASTRSVSRWTATSTSPAPMQSCCPVSLRPILGGRYVEFVIYPFSFRRVHGAVPCWFAPDASIQQCFQKYLLAGGMPYLANLRLCGCAVQAISSRSVQLRPAQGHCEAE